MNEARGFRGGHRALAISVVGPTAFFMVVAAACSSDDPGASNPGGKPDAGATLPDGAPLPANAAALAWDAVTQHADGTPLTDLTGYVVHYGTAPGAYVTAVPLQTETTHVVTDLAPGTYFFTVTALDSHGGESEFSNEVSKTIP